MFGKVMEDGGLYREVLECLHGKPVGELALQDHTVKYFFICTCQGEELSETLSVLYRYIMTGEPQDELTGKLHRAVETGRRNEKWRAEYVKELLHDDDIREEGRWEGREEGRAEGREERMNTEREKAGADALEAKVREVEEIINKMNR
ncbi:MAG: hypothetical protein ACI4HQ_14310 [Acetatifactor sp.]